MSRSVSSSSAGRIWSRMRSLVAFQAAEFQQRLAARFIGAQPGPAQLLGLLIDVEANLFVEPAFERARGG